MKHSIMQARTFDFDKMLLDEAAQAVHPAAITPLIRMAKQVGAENTTKALQCIKRDLAKQAQIPEYIEPSISPQPSRGSCTAHGSVIMNDGSVIAW